METASYVTTRINRRCIEENVLAILDSPGCKVTQDSHDDRIAFLEAVRAACLVNGIPPTIKIREAVFQILHAAASLDLIMESYRLLTDLDKYFPCATRGELQSSEMMELEEAWSPFAFNLDVTASERVAADKTAAGSLDSLGFHLLIQSLVEVSKGIHSQALETKSLGKMLLIQYLVNFLEGDFMVRSRLYEETLNWTLLRDSLLNMLLSSRRINYKSLLKDCLGIICRMSDISSGINHSSEFHIGNAALAFAVPELGTGACIAVQKFLIMIMELDILRKTADVQGFTTRADGVRTPLLEIMLDELTYGPDMIFPFLQIFNEPKWKLDIILQYFSKYTTKPPTRTQSSKSSTVDASLNGVLKCFSSITKTRNIVKKMGGDLVQMLLAHAFQAYLSLTLCQQRDDKDEDRSPSIEEICGGLISAFTSLKTAYEKLEVLPFAKEALFAATSTLSTNSLET